MTHSIGLYNDESIPAAVPVPLMFAACIFNDTWISKGPSRL